MHTNDAYFAHSTIQFPNELKKIFDRIMHELQYREHPHHFTLDLDSFPVTNVELEYMFDTLGFLGLHHDSPPYLLYLLEKLVDGISEESTKHTTLRSITTTRTIRSHDWYQSIIERGISNCVR